MAQPLDLDPSSSVAAYFGAELRRFRLAASLTQERLGDVINYTGALVGLVETAKRTPTREFAERCDVALDTDGALIRLWPLLSRATFPAFVRHFVELEATATQIRSFECQLVPGLLQTPDYARAVLAARAVHSTPDVLDEAVSARMSRQAILKGSPAPLCWFVLDEAVLRRRIGSSAVMRAQLAQFLEVTRLPNVFVQVVPFDAGEYPGLDGGLTLLSFADAPDIGYIESHGGSSVLIESPGPVAECNLAFDLTRATALSPRLSADMIKAAMEDL
ncbi:MAG TPA: helix-turn-helix transcriptional regulator [Actinocrinis sp.]|nr:helix-turn-helix transcriptional regulator [Actinocrinis sp.]